jgi:hypothetical protein
VGECHATAKLVRRHGQRFAHITEQKKAGWRNAIGMSCDRPIANVDFSVREEFAKVIIRPTIAKAQLEHLTRQAADQRRSQV